MGGGFLIHSARYTTPTARIANTTPTQHKESFFEAHELTTVTQLELFREVKPLSPRLIQLLWEANSDPPSHRFRHSFYRLKSELLEAHGYRDGYDWQRITHTCNRCDGTGIWGYWRDDGGDWCWKCEGTGIYHRFYVKLLRWKLGDRVFHQPHGDRLDELPEGEEIKIDGLIRHAKVKCALESFLWLCLWCDRDLFWQAIKYPYLLSEGTSRFTYSKPCGPLTAVNHFVYRRRSRRPFARRETCGRLRLWFQPDCQCDTCIPF